MIRRLYANTRNEFTNFVILDDKFNVVAQSKPNIKNIIDKKETFSKYLSKGLKALNGVSSSKEFHIWKCLVE